MRRARHPYRPIVPPADVRFAAGEQTHTVGLTEERAGQVVRQSSNARMVAFLAVLIFVLFIPIYWLYDIGLPVLGMPGRLEKEASEQYVTDVVARLRALPGQLRALPRQQDGEPGNGLGNIGPALNDQAKLYKALTDSGSAGHRPPQSELPAERAGGWRTLRLRRPEERDARLARARRSAQLPRGPGDHHLDPCQQGHRVCLRACAPRSWRDPSATGHCPGLDAILPGHRRQARRPCPLVGAPRRALPLCRLRRP